MIFLKIVTLLFVLCSWSLLMCVKLNLCSCCCYTFFEGTLQLSYNDCFLYCVSLIIIIIIIIMMIIIIRLSQEDEKADVKIRLCIFPEVFWAFWWFRSHPVMRHEFFSFYQDKFFFWVNWCRYHMNQIIQTVMTKNKVWKKKFDQDYLRYWHMQCTVL